MPIKLSFVIPCYDEQQVLRSTFDELFQLLSRLIEDGKVSSESTIYFVDDGSRDSTWRIIEDIVQFSSNAVGVKLAANVGHQFALLAGLMTADGDAVISLDADLQDDISVVEEMIDRFTNGSEIVLGVRRRRDKDTFFKRYSAIAYYRILEFMGARVVRNHADFRLMGRAAIEALRAYGESNLYLRGIVTSLGFTLDTVYYDRKDRFAGESKYTLSMMIGLALSGITSFSVVPLRMISYLGLAVFTFSAAMGFWILYVGIFTEAAVPGWASITLPIYFIGGVQILCIGVLGEYVGRIYGESKRRPRYCVEKVARCKND